MAKRLPPLQHPPSPANAQAAKRPPEVTFQSGSEGADVFFKATGLQALEDNLRALGKVAVDAAGYEMADIMREVIIDSQENYVPVDTGDLHDAANSDDYTPGSGATITKIAAWYASPGDQGGGPGLAGLTTKAHSGEDTSIGSRAAAQAATVKGKMARLKSLHEAGGGIHEPRLYALDQHENPTYKHGLNYSGSGPGQMEYLKRPFDKKVGSMLQRIGIAVGRAMGTNAPSAFSTPETGPVGE